MSETSRSRARRACWIVAASLAVVLAVSVGLWLRLSGQALSSVEVLPQSLRCDGKTVPVTIPEESIEDAAPRPTFETRIDVDSECWLTVTVANTGQRAVTVESLTFPSMMPGPARGVLLETTEDVFTIPPHDVDPDGEDYGDAVFTVGETIEAGAWTSLVYRIGYRADGATCTGVTAQVKGFPVAHVSAAGRSADVAGSVAIIHPSVKTTGNRNCRLDQ